MYFSYGGEFFEQLEGAAMGSPVSAAVVNLYIEFFEEVALRTATMKPRLWKRYIDDTCCIMKDTVESSRPTYRTCDIHQVHCGGGEGREAPFPRHLAPEEG